MGTDSPDDPMSGANEPGEGGGVPKTTAAHDDPVAEAGALPGKSAGGGDTLATESAGAEDSGDDRRDQSRAPIELKVEYKRLNTFFSDYTKNISRGGTFIKTARPLPIGTEFLFKLFVPVLSAPLVLRGQVQWIVSEDEVLGRGRDAVAGMGIRFVDLEGAAQRDLERVVEKLMVDSLGQLLYSRLMDTGKGPR